MITAFRNRTVKKRHLLYGSTLLVLLFITAGHGMEFRTGNQLIIAADETVNDDLYLAGATVVIDGTVKGDVIAAAQTVTVNGTVEGDLLAAAQNITINGRVENTARLAAAVITVGDTGQIGGDVVATGYSLETQAGSQVGRDLSYAGRQALLAGSLAGDAIVASYGLEVRGSIGGNLQADVAARGMFGGPAPARLAPTPAVAGGLALAEGAGIAGDLELTTPRSVTVREGVVQGEVRNHVASGRAASARSFMRDSLSRYLALAVVGLLLLWRVPSLVTRAGSALEARPWPSLGWGALTLAGVPLALLVALGLVIGLAVLLRLIALEDLGVVVAILGGMVVLVLGVLFGFILAYLPQIVVAYLGGRWLLGRLNLAENTWLALLIGLLLVVLLTALPIVGWLASLALILFGLGALWLGRRARLPRQAQVEAPHLQPNP